MPTQTSRPPFAPGAQGQPAGQAAPAPAQSEGYTTKPQADRHEALWLSLSALHKDTVALGAKKPNADVSDALRISAEGLLSDCAPFIRQRRERLPVAAPDLSGLAAQLGQALAALENWESRHTSWDERFNCRVWRLDRGYLPIMRLKPPAAALKAERTDIADPGTSWPGASNSASAASIKRATRRAWLLATARPTAQRLLRARAAHPAPTRAGACLAPARLIPVCAASIKLAPSPRMGGLQANSGGVSRVGALPPPQVRVWRPWAIDPGAAHTVPKTGTPGRRSPH
jgi:hypothetical protein